MGQQPEPGPAATASDRADKIVVIHGGEIVEQGTHQQLLDQRGFFYQLYISQFKGQQI